MKRCMLLALGAVALLLQAYVPLVPLAPLVSEAHAAESLDVAKADEVHRAAADRGADIATEALELLETVEEYNEKARELGVSVSQLPEKDRTILRETSKKLGTLYANNMLEASLVRDMQLLDNLYKASMLLYSQQRKYVEQTGSAKGFEQYFAGIKLDREQHFYMEILLYLQRLVPSQLEANPGTPTPGSRP